MFMRGETAESEYSKIAIASTVIEDQGVEKLDQNCHT